MKQCTHELLGVLAGGATVPVVVEADELGAGETVGVHERAKGSSNLGFLGSGDLASGVCGVAVLRLVLTEIS